MRFVYSVSFVYEINKGWEIVHVKFVVYFN
jgi:hypothetical protein